MIVTALIQLREVKPNVNICVVALCLIFSMLYLLSGASYNDELITQGAGRVTVALVLHSILAQDAIGAILNHYFKALIEGVRCFLEVTPTNQEEAARWRLHTLIVMREVHSHVYLVLQQLLCLKDVLVDELRVTLQDIQTLDQVDILLGIRLELLDDSILHFLVLACEALLALSLALVVFEFIVGHNAVAIGTFESDVIEKLAEEFVHCLLWEELVA